MGDSWDSNDGQTQHLDENGRTVGGLDESAVVPCEADDRSGAPIDSETPNAIDRGDVRGVLVWWKPSWAGYMVYTHHPDPPTHVAHSLSDEAQAARRDALVDAFEALLSGHQTYSAHTLARIAQSTLGLST